MSIDVDLQQFINCAIHFFNISKIHLALYDDDFNLKYMPQRTCEFCEEIWKRPELKKYCKQSNNNALLKCKQTKQPYIYRCHMGLWEIATPIVENDFVIGYVMFGQILGNNDISIISEKAKLVAETYGLDYELMNKTLFSKERMDHDRINSLAQILKMCSNYIWMNNIVSVKKQTITYIINSFIDEHMSNNLSIQAICSEFGISRSALYQIALTHFGCGISNYIKNKRMEKAKELLASTSKSISEITALVGISDPPYFNNCFKKYVGITPRQYRNSQSGDSRD